MAEAEKRFAKLDQPLKVVRKKKKDILEVARIHGIVNILIFGSLVRNEATPNSDIDLLVDLEKGRSLLDLGGASVKLYLIATALQRAPNKREIHYEQR